MSKNIVTDRHGKMLKSFPTYEQAVRHGQNEYGHFNFCISTPGRIPSREEQLLRTTKHERKISILDSL